MKGERKMKKKYCGLEITVTEFSVRDIMNLSAFDVEGSDMEWID